MFIRMGEDFEQYEDAHDEPLRKTSTNQPTRHHIHHGHAGHWFLVEAVKPDFTPALLSFNILLCLNLHILGNISNSSN